MPWEARKRATGKHIGNISILDGSVIKMPMMGTWLYISRHNLIKFMKQFHTFKELELALLCCVLDPVGMSFFHSAVSFICMFCSLFFSVYSPRLGSDRLNDATSSHLRTLSLINYVTVI